jgi:uncharacterized membrane protein YgdD (TMEM256/DUF423 family)
MSLALRTELLMRTRLVCNGKILASSSTFFSSMIAEVDGSSEGESTDHRFEGARAIAAPTRVGGFLAAVLGFTGVALGALGAHALEDPLEAAGGTAVWKTAADYHLAHALALLGLSALAQSLGTRPRLFLATALCWAVGTLFFAGSLYWLALDGPSWLGPVTPFGGLLLLVGWVNLGIAISGRIGSTPDKVRTRD